MTLVVRHESLSGAAPWAISSPLRLDWSAVEPGGSLTDWTVLAAFRDAAMRQSDRGGQVAVILDGRSLPPDIEHAGGWNTQDTARRFLEYGELAYDVAGDLVDVWIAFDAVEAGHRVTEGHRHLGFGLIAAALAERAQWDGTRTTVLQDMRGYCAP